MSELRNSHMHIHYIHPRLTNNEDSLPEKAMLKEARDIMSVPTINLLSRATKHTFRMLHDHQPSVIYAVN